MGQPRRRRASVWAGVYVGLFGVPGDADTETESDGLPADDPDDSMSTEG